MDDEMFIISIEDARKALFSEKNIGSIYLTISAQDSKHKSSFLTAWLSSELGELLLKQGQRVYPTQSV